VKDNFSAQSSGYAQFRPGYPAQLFDLLTVGQAAHWFVFEKFYPEARRVLKPGGLLALVGYNLLRVDEPTEAVIEYFYNTTLKGCWDGERYLVEQAYRTISFPFDEIPFPEMDSNYSWTVDQLLGYLGTWSAVQHFIRKNGRSPIDEMLFAQLKEVWPEGEVRIVRFPIFARVGFNNQTLDFKHGRTTTQASIPCVFW